MCRKDTKITIIIDKSHPSVSVWQESVFVWASGENASINFMSRSSIITLFAYYFESNQACTFISFLFLSEIEKNMFEKCMN